MGSNPTATAIYQHKRQSPVTEVTGVCAAGCIVVAFACCAAGVGSSVVLSSSLGPTGLVGFHSSLPTLVATSGRMAAMMCWYRAAMAVLGHPLVPASGHMVDYRRTVVPS